eukprot:3610676-Amphidinium_carterae.1
MAAVEVVAGGSWPPTQTSALSPEPPRVGSKVKMASVLDQHSEAEMRMRMNDTVSKEFATYKAKAGTAFPRLRVDV